MERINWISRRRTLCWIFWEKNSLTESNILETCQTLILSVSSSAAIWFPFGFCQFPDTCRSQKNQSWLIRSRRISCTWREDFRLCQKERFLEPIGKSPYIANYLWAGVNSIIAYSIILVITKIYIFSLRYFASVLLFIMWRQPSSIAWTVTSTAAFYHCSSYMEHSDLWIRCVAYIWY